MIARAFGAASAAALVLGAALICARARQTDYDAERDKILTARGLRVMRFKNEEVLRDLKSVLARIQGACGGKT